MIENKYQYKKQARGTIYLRAYQNLKQKVNEISYTKSVSCIKRNAHILQIQTQQKQKNEKSDAQGQTFLLQTFKQLAEFINLNKALTKNFNPRKICIENFINVFKSGMKKLSKTYGKNIEVILQLLGLIQYIQKQLKPSYLCLFGFQSDHRKIEAIQNDFCQLKKRIRNLYSKKEIKSSQYSINLMIKNVGSQDLKNYESNYLYSSRSRTKLTNATTRPSSCGKSRYSCKKKYERIFTRNDYLEEINNGFLDNKDSSRKLNLFSKRAQTSKNKALTGQMMINDKNLIQNSLQRKDRKSVPINQLKLSRSSEKVNIITKVEKNEEGRTIQYKQLKKSQNILQIDKQQSTKIVKVDQTVQRRNGQFIIYTQRQIQQIDSFISQNNLPARKMIKDKQSSNISQIINEQKEQTSNNNAHYSKKNKVSKTSRLMNKQFQKKSRWKKEKSGFLQEDEGAQNSKAISSKKYKKNIKKYQSSKLYKKQKSIKQRRSGSKNNSQAFQDSLISEQKQKKTKKDQLFKIKVRKDEKQIDKFRERRNAIERKITYIRKNSLVSDSMLNKKLSQADSETLISCLEKKKENSFKVSAQNVQNLRKDFQNSHSKNVLIDNYLTQNSIFFTEQDYIAKQENKKWQKYIKTLKTARGVEFIEPFGLQMHSIDTKKIRTLEKQRYFIFKTQGEILEKIYSAQDPQIKQILLNSDTFI